MAPQTRTHTQTQTQTQTQTHTHTNTHTHTHTQTHTHTHAHTQPNDLPTQPTTQITRPGGMREALRRPTGYGVRDMLLDLLGLVLVLPGVFGCSLTPLLSPTGAAHSAWPTQKKRVPPLLASKIESKISLDF